MGTFEEPGKTSQTKNILIWIMGIVLVLPLLFFTAVRGLGLESWTLYFMQLGLYAVFGLLAWWGIKTERIKLPLGGGKWIEAVGFTLVGWLVYLAVVLGLGMASGLDDSRPGIIAAKIISTWLFVGIGEELLFRGYFLPGIRTHFTNGDERRRTTLAVVLSSLFFSLWHFPARLVSLFSGELGVGLLLVSLVVLFVYGLAFGFLYVRSENILLVGLVHGLMDFPLIGKSTELSFIILLVAIGCVEIGRKLK